MTMRGIDEAGNEVPVASFQLDGKLVTVAEGVLSLDGHKMVLESDLIAAKKSLESQAEQAQIVHNASIDTVKLEVSAAQQQAAALNAKVTELEHAREAGVASEADVTKLKTELETAKTQLNTANATVLDMHRARIVLSSNGAVTAEQLSEKSPEQLAAFEEALKTVSRAGGPGAYVAGSGGGDITPETPMERAGRILAATPVRGVRTAETT